MKTKIFWKWSLGISLAVVPFLGCGQRSTATYSAPAVVQGQPMVSNFVEEPAVLSGDEALPEEADQDLANAPAELVSPAKLADRISPAAAELVKLAQAGVDESVMMAFVTNSTLVFNLTSDDIVYLNDVG